MNKLLFSCAFAGALSLAATSSHATLLRFTADLDGPSEFPANVSPGNGSTTVDLDTSTHTLRVQFTFSDLLGNTTASHIHCCVSPSAATPVAGVATAVPSFPGFPIGVTAGSYDQTFDLTLPTSFNPAFITAHGGTTAGAEAFLTAGMLAGESYLNIHSNLFPGGEIRGFLQPVPEPGILGLLGLGLCAGLWSLRQRRA